LNEGKLHGVDPKQFGVKHIKSSTNQSIDMWKSLFLGRFDGLLG